jgi:glycerate kinase
VIHFDPNSVERFARAVRVGASGGIGAGVLYLIKKYVDLRFDVWKHRKLEREKALPPVIYDPNGRIVKR